MTHEERRHSPRYQVHDIEGCFQYRLRCQVLDLSIAGMSVQSTSRLNVGRRYIFKLHNGNKEVEIPGTVVWCVLQGTQKNDHGEVQPLYRAGVGFQDVLSPRAHTLAALIQENMLVEPDSRLFGRFRPRNGDTLQLDAEEPFTVVQLSATGMLVRSRVMPDLETVIPVELNLRGQAFHASVRVVNVQPDAAGGAATLGLELLDLDQGSHSILREHLLHLAGRFSPS